jgi:hypothetical protein
MRNNLWRPVAVHRQPHPIPRAMKSKGNAASTRIRKIICFVSNLTTPHLRRIKTMRGIMVTLPELNRLGGSTRISVSLDLAKRSVDSWTADQVGTV